MAEPVFFSVLIPVYNVESYLHECLGSVLSQGWEKLELLPGDNGTYTSIAPKKDCADFRLRMKLIK